MGGLNWCFRMGVHLSHMLDNTIHDAPFDKIQLTNCGSVTHKLNSLGPTKWIKEFFRVSIETALILNVYWKTSNSDPG